MVSIVAHRGYSARQPESTRAAYAEAIAWSAATGVPLVVECDVHFSADDQLICLHDLRVDRTSDGVGPAYQRTVAELRRLDFGSWRVRRSTADQRALVTLEELLDLVAAARTRGVDVSVAVETKHPNPRGLDVDDHAAALLAARGWDAHGSPARVMSFLPEAVDRLGRLLPELPRTLLVEHTLGDWSPGVLPPGVGAVGPDLRLLRRNPDFAALVRRHGGEVHPWTANSRADIAFCRRLGVEAITTDDPARVAAALGGRRPRRT